MKEIEAISPYFWQIVEQQLEGVSAERLLIMSLAGALFIHLIILIYSRVTESKVQAEKEVVWILIMVYACCILQITLFRRSGMEERIGIRSTLDFGSISGDYLSLQQLVYSLLNVCLFIPWSMWFCHL